MQSVKSIKNDESDFDSDQNLSELEKIEEFYDLLEKKPKVSEQQNYLKSSASFPIFQGSNRLLEKNIDEHLDSNFSYLKPKKIWLLFESSQKPLEEVNLKGDFIYKI